MRSSDHSSPVRSGPHPVLVPGGSGQQCSPAGQPTEAELAAARAKEPVEVRRVDAAPRRELPHRGRLRGDGEREQARLVPRRDRFDEVTRREAAPPDRADALTLDDGGLRVGDARPEHELVRRRQGGERDDVLPDHLGWGGDDDGRAHRDQVRCRPPGAASAPSSSGRARIATE